VNVFVYGTLRSGGRASGLLRGCECLGARTLPGTLYDLGAYPALVLEGEGRVEGEVWRCPGELLHALDEYEGVPRGLYRRVPVEVEGVECWTYVAGPGLARILTPEWIIPSGRWARE
jgi:gamma-glutamylcyclotransferase (GGCT)/AIG2-like uncharacterized protein YtfP